jgi:DNA polymerase I-like protein with 3'-5' exonuclease and polymerase domains/uracil-DNA glycosylase
MNKRLRLAVRNAACTGCKLHRDTDEEGICTTGSGPNEATIGIVTQFPTAPDSSHRKAIETSLSEFGLKPSTFMWLSAVKCRAWSATPSKGDLKACRPYLDRELEFLNLSHVLTLGGEALFAATGRSGIVKWRGQLYTHPSGSVVFPTISPSAVTRNPRFIEGFLGDLRYFANTVQGVEPTQDPWHLPYDDQWTGVMEKKDLYALRDSLRTADAASYDIETTGASEFDADARIVSLAITTMHGDTPHVWALPLFHPESPWKTVWERILRWLAKWLCLVPKRIAHNAKFDTRWLVHFGMPNLKPTFDTIIATSLLDENRQKGLKPLAQQLLGADPWGIDTKDLLTTPLAQVLDYNGLDTWHTLRLWMLFRKQLKAQPRVANLFMHLMMPAIQELVHVERRGVYVDQSRLVDNWSQVRGTLAGIESLLMEHVPDADDVPAKLKHKKTGEINVNWNASNFLRWFLFTYLELPVMARGKMKDDGSPGDPSCAEDIMMALAPQSPVAKLLVERVEWNKYDTAFFKPYSDQLITSPDGRIRTVFKPWGTVTGRLSSGKEDKEKVTGRAQLRGVNLQQVPRNKLVRGVFGAGPGWAFVEADYSQIELRLAAYLARERTMLQLYATGQDIHMAMAMRMTGKPAHLVTAEERKRAKAVNFGFLYGMGWMKFIMTAFSNYGLIVTEEESKAFRTSFFDQFPGLMPWHAKQRKLAYEHKRVETPMGRIRHLTDMDSPNHEVRAEAERQAINSPVQGFASDMALLSMVHTARLFRKHGIEAYPIGAVHDAVNFEIRIDDLPTALPLIKETMENLPLEKLFGINLDVPIIADLKVGSHWGGATEVPADLLSPNRRANVNLRNWLQDTMKYELELAA